MSSVPTPRSATAARVHGDDFQFLVALDWALRALRPEAGIESIEIEAYGVTAVDDIVIRRIVPPHEYQQVKASLDAREPISGRYLMAPHGESARSLLERLHRAWVDLGRDGRRPKLALVTTRPVEAGDALLALVDRHETIADGVRRASAESETSRAAATWAEHLRIGPDQLIPFLEDLRFVLHGNEASWRDIVRVRLAYQGFDNSDEAIEKCIGRVRDWVKDSRRKLTPGQIALEFASLRLTTRLPTGLLVVDAVDRSDPRVISAAVRLDWVDHYEGGSASERILLRDQQLWDTRLPDELREAAMALRRLGYRRVEVDGNMRLPTWFAVGGELREVAGWSVVNHRHQITWDGGDLASVELGAPRVEHLGQGDDIVVGVEVSAEVAEEVVAFVRANMLPVRRALFFTFPGGAHPRAVGDGRIGVGFARAVRKAVQSAAAKDSAERVHLFVSSPGGFALMLGHFWDRIPSTQTYDWLGPGRGYAAAFLVR